MTRRLTQPLLVVHDEAVNAQPVCSPLCGASKAYGRFDQPWKHEPECPVRIAWEKQKEAAREPKA